MNESQTGINIARRNINNLRYEDVTTLMADTEEDLKSLLMKVKDQSEKLAWISTFKTQIVASSLITSWQIDRERWKNKQILIFSASKITADGECSHKPKRC